MFDGGYGSTGRMKVLEYLAESEGEFIPGSSLAVRLGFSRQALHKTVCALRSEGLDISSSPGKGYMIKNMADTDAMSSTLMDYLLRDNDVFHKTVCFPSVTSTQHVIKKLARQDAPEGVVAVADEQTEGRGRRGRSWHTPPSKGLLFSALLRPGLRPGDVQLLNLAAGLAVKSVLKENYMIDAELKWPNDILAGGRKLCGILSETAGEPDRIYYAVTGIGLNVNLSEEDLDEDVRDRVTSIKIETGAAVARPILLSQILHSLSSCVKDLRQPDGKEKLISSYRRECGTIGREVNVFQDGEKFTGTAVGITEQGALIMKTDNEEKVFAAADVHHLRLGQKGQVPHETVGTRPHERLSG